MMTRGFGRLLALVGSVGVVVSTFLPWVTIQGLPLHLDLLGTNVSAIRTTVSGTDTKAWPPLVGVAGVAALLALFGILRKLLVLIGLLTLIAGAGLVYYVTHVIDIETSHNTLQRTAAHLAVASSTEPGPFVLLAAGICMFLGGLAAAAR
ncbi:MAG TPA: Trp biosynthesis-associated membrane protein [Sporichthyaceae bacterium]|jgi:hypothetical protein